MSCTEAGHSIVTTGKPAGRTPESRLRDLLRGLGEARGADLVYEEPGWLEHVTDRFGAALLAADQATEAAAER